MKRILPAVIIQILLASCVTSSNQPIPRSVEDLSHKEDVYKVIGHLYRWYLDEIDIQKATKAGNSTIWLREMTPKLDPGDKSRFAELILPVLGVMVTLKKTDYTIEELNIKVATDNFKITRVSRINMPKNLEKAYIPVNINRDDLRKYLFTRRGEVKFPDEKLTERLRSTVRSQVRQHLQGKNRKLPDTPQAVHFAPLSPVANELWVFWEAGRILIHFSSDLDINNPHAREYDKLSARIYDIDEQVVVSLQEVPGSNAYLTRDQVGRALYNCMILGKRVILEPVP